MIHNKGWIERDYIIVDDDRTTSFPQSPFSISRFFIWACCLNPSSFNHTTTYTYVSAYTHPNSQLSLTATQLTTIWAARTRKDRDKVSKGKAIWDFMRLLLTPSYHAYLHTLMLYSIFSPWGNDDAFFMPHTLSKTPFMQKTFCSPTPLLISMTREGMNKLATEF